MKFESKDTHLFSNALVVVGHGASSFIVDILNWYTCYTVVLDKFVFLVYGRTYLGADLNRHSNQISLQFDQISSAKC